MYDLNQRNDAIEWKFEFELNMNLLTFLTLKNPVLTFLNILSSPAPLLKNHFLIKNVHLNSALVSTFSNIIYYLYSQIKIISATGIISALDLW